MCSDPKFSYMSPRTGLQFRAALTSEPHLTGIERMNVHSSAAGETILIEKDVEVPMRDGARLLADVFRPKAGARVPAMLNLGP